VRIKEEDMIMAIAETGEALKKITGISERVKKLRDQCINSEPAICSERALILTEVYRQNEDKQINIKRALAVAGVLDRMSIYILDGELIVGNHSGILRAAPVFPEFDVNYIEAELNEFEKRTGDRFLISEENKKSLSSIIPYWKGRTVKDRILSMLSEEIIKGGHGQVGAFDDEWALENGDGHLAIDYPKLLRLGFKGLLEEINEKITSLDRNDPEHILKENFYRSLIIIYEAAVRFANRFAVLAEDMAKNVSDPRRRDELLEIAGICGRVPEYPAETFREAVQVVWFGQLIIQLETNGHSVSIGRFDQFAYPFLKKDIDEGRLNEEEALEILQCFWVKLASITKLRSWSQTRLNAGHPMFQNLTIGGQKTDGEDAVNRLTFLLLDCHDTMRLSQPTLTARVHKNSPHQFLRRCVEVLSRGGGMPAFFNDDIIIPSLLLRGVTKEDAYNYCMVGCVEQSVAGKWGGRYGASNLSLTKCLELALNGGKDPRTGIHLHGNGRCLKDYKSFDEIMDAFKSQLSYYLDLYTKKDNIQDYVWEEMLPTPFVSGLVDDCIARGKEIKKGGAVYDFSGGQTGNIANVANSLTAIKKLVFEEGLITREALQGALDSNFEGPGGEEIRQLLINRAPKYGNDDDYVDSIAREAFSHYMTELAAHKNTRYGRGPIGGTFHPSTASVAYNVPAGAIIGATPDGRKKGEALADVESPARGTEMNGPTAVVKSVSKLEHIMESGGSILNLKFNPAMFNGPKQLDNLVALIRAYFELSGMEIQILIVSAEKLKAAQKQPEKYRDLLVRVAGYSTYFVALDPEIQNDIIARTEHQNL
jgi:pyruvate formate-lyase/glycerol dehydratase family glycyl radical enzyme